MSEKNEESRILYICDRKKCEDCSYPICCHTEDVAHAKNFEHIDVPSVNAFIEKE